MAGGKRYKFQGSTIQFLTGWAAYSPSLVVAGITNADPAVVNVAAHGRSDGDVVRILGALGMTEVNDKAFVVDATDSSHFKLLGIDSTDYGAYTSGGRLDAAEFSQLCELTGYNRQGGTSPTIQATSICSDAQEYEIGLPDFGTVQVDYNFAPQTTVQQAIQAAYEAGTDFAVKITLPNSGGVMVQLGFIQQTSESVQVGDIWKGSFTMKCTGKRFDFAG